MQNKVKNAQILSYALLIVISVILFIISNALPDSRWEPLGAGAFPKIVLACIILCASIGIVLELSVKKNIDKKQIKDDSKKNNLFVVLMFVILFLYLGLTPLLGFKISTFCFLFLSQLLLGPRNFKSILKALIISLILSVGVYILFAQAFSIFLPRFTWFEF